MKLCLAKPLLVVVTLLFFQAHGISAAPMNVVFSENLVAHESIPFPEQAGFQSINGGDIYQLRIIYMIPSNRSPQSGAEKKLQQYILRKQAWFSEQMELSGYGPKTFKYETEDDGITPLVNVVFMDQPDTYFHGSYIEKWNKVLYGIANAGYPPWHKGELLFVVSETQVQQEVDGSFLEASVFVGGVGTNFSGVGMVTGETLARLSKAYLTDNRFYDGIIIPAIGPYPLTKDISFSWYEGSTLSSTYSSAQGAALHELAHGLGLGHDFRNDVNFNGNLMGSGLRGIRGEIYPEVYPDDGTRLATGSALQLNYNRFFNFGKTYSEDDPPQVDILTNGTVVPHRGHCQLDFTVSDTDSPLGGAILTRANNVVAEIALNQEQHYYTISTYDYEPGVQDEWNLTVFDTQGNRAKSSKALITCATGYNRAPHPFISVRKSRVEVGEEVIIDASNSLDPDGDSSQLMVEWDLDGDGKFDTGPSTKKVRSTVYSEPGIYQIIARLTDDKGDPSDSMRIGIKVE